jgi:hypothetical protein
MSDPIIFGLHFCNERLFVAIVCVYVKGMLKEWGCEPCVVQSSLSR